MKRPIILWGHRRVGPGYNTLAYVWEGYAKAFAFMGHEVQHVPDAPTSIEAIRPESIIFAEGQEDRWLPKRADCTYVLHNCAFQAYDAAGTRRLALQVYTEDVFARTVTTLDRFTYHQPVPGCHGILYQPWASDLLPHEIDPAHPPAQTEPIFAWCGTIGDGRFGNRPQLQPYIDAAHAKGLPFVHRDGLSPAAHRVFIESAQYAPVIVGAWQLEKGYVPCRLWKNMAYGHAVISNSPIFTELYGGRSRTDAMAHVQVFHTLVNRARRILEVIR